MNPLEEIYNNLYKFALQYRKKTTAPSTCNHMFEALRDSLGEVGQLEFRRWNPELQFGGPLYLTFTAKIMPLPETIINGRGESHIIDKNHFMMQIFRIAENETPNIYNLLRIAIYSGLLLANLKADDFPPGVVKAYKDLNMQNMINYAERADYQQLLEKLPPVLNANLMEAMSQIKVVRT